MPTGWATWSGASSPTGGAAGTARPTTTSSPASPTSPSGWRSWSATTRTPRIIGWCPLNETAQTLHDRITVLDDATRALFLAAKAMDTTRPVLDTSGYSHRVPEADIYDSHDYIEEKNFAEGLENFTQRHAGLPEGRGVHQPAPQHQQPDASQQIWSVPYRGQPYFVSEFGGFKWNPHDARQERRGEPEERTTSWGYGSDPTSLEDFYRRFEAVCDVLLDNPSMFGYCYTQLTDIYPEENGIYAFDRDAQVRRPAPAPHPAPPRRH